MSKLGDLLLLVEEKHLNCRVQGRPWHKQELLDAVAALLAEVRTTRDAGYVPVMLRTKTIEQLTLRAKGKAVLGDDDSLLLQDLGLKEGQKVGMVKK